MAVALSGWRSALTPTLSRHLGLALGGGILLLLLSSQIGAYDDYNLAAVAIFAIATAGLNLLTGVNGQLSLGHGALMAVGAYSTSLLLRGHDLPLLLVLLASLAGASLVGAVFGVAAARLRGPYLAGATLALAVGLPQIATRYSHVFGGEEGLTVSPPAAPAWLGADFPPERWMAWIAVAVALVTMVLLGNLLQSSVGRSFKAVRDHEAAAALAGINVARTQVVAFVVSSACAGLAGSLFAYWSGLTCPLPAADQCDRDWRAGQPERRRLGLDRAGVRASPHQWHGQQPQPAELGEQQPAAVDLRRGPGGGHAGRSLRHRRRFAPPVRPGSRALGRGADQSQGGGGLGRSRGGLALKH